MLHNRKLITTSFLLLALCNCFGMELPKDQPLINFAKHAALFDTIIQKAPEILPYDEKLEPLFHDIEYFLANNDLTPKRQASTLHNDEKADLGNGNNETAKGAGGTPDSKKRRFECPTCKKSVTNLTRHMLIHTGEKSYHCNQCIYSCADGGDLTRHMRIHTGEKPFTCKQCNYSCTQNSNLKKHMRTHTREKPFKCDQCHYSCARSDVLTVHRRIHTTDEKPHHCDQCNRSFKQSIHLTRHIQTHTGEKPYHHDQCHLSFAQTGNLQQHISKVHKDLQTRTDTEKKDYISHQVYADTEKK